MNIKHIIKYLIVSIFLLSGCGLFIGAVIGYFIGVLEISKAYYNTRGNHMILDNLVYYSGYTLLISAFCWFVFDTLTHKENEN